MRDRFDLVDCETIGIGFAEQGMVVLFDDVVGAGDVLVREVGAHPALAHHRGRYLDDAVDLRRERPHVVVVEERPVAAILGRRGHAYE